MTFYKLVNMKHDIFIYIWIYIVFQFDVNNQTIFEVILNEVHITMFFIKTGFNEEINFIKYFLIYYEYALVFMRLSTNQNVF